MKIFVTGGTGFIGKRLIPRLVAEGYQVSVLVRKKLSTSFIRQVKIVIGELEKPDSFVNELNNCDILIHLAAMKTNWSREEKVFPINSDVISLLVTPHSSLKHIIVTSSVYVFGKLKKLPANEMHPLGARDIYGKSKIRLEKATIKVSKDHSIPYTIVRPALTYGPGDSATGFMTKLINMVKKPWFPMIGQGNNLLHLIYIDDLIESYIKIIKKGPKNTSLILAGPKPIRLDLLVALIEKQLQHQTKKIYIPRFLALISAHLTETVFKTASVFFPSLLDIEPPLTVIKVETLTGNWDYDISKARRLLNFNPKVDYKKGIEETMSTQK